MIINILLTYITKRLLSKSIIIIFKTDLNSIQTKLFGEHFKSLFSTHIVLEKVQLKRVYPPERIGPRRSLATHEHGLLPSKEGRPSSRSYLFNLSSSLITGASDDFSISPEGAYVAYNMGALGLMNNSKLIQHQDPTESIINLLSPFGALQIEIPSKDESSPQSLVLRLALKTNRADAVVPFYPVDYIACSGFAMNAQASAIPQAPVPEELTSKKVTYEPKLSDIELAPKGAQLEDTKALDLDLENMSLSDEKKGGSL